MRKYIAMLCVFMSCNYVYAQEESKIGLQLRGTHELFALNNDEINSSESSGAIFLYIGSFTSENKTENIVKFIWKNNEGQYQLSSLPFNKVRFIIQETATSTVKFRWNTFNKNIPAKDIMDSVIYAVFAIDKSQIKSDIKFEL